MLAVMLQRRRPHRGDPPVAVRALAGLLAAGAALAAAEAVAALTGVLGSPVTAVGGATIDRTPRPLKEFAIRTFGEADKAVLLGGILATIALYACVVGALAWRRTRLAAAAVGLLGAVAAAAAVSRPTASPVDALPALVGAAVGAGILVLLVRASRLAAPAPTGLDLPTMLARTDRSDGGWDRRGLLLTAAGVGAAATVSGGIGRYALTRQNDVSASRAAVRLPAPASPAPALPAGVQPDIPGITRFTTPNPDFYRVDTALVLPSVRAEDWSLRVHGMVDRELRIDYTDLLDRPMVERDITLTCVSNEVGGRLAGNARWLGVTLADVLEAAGVHADADQLVSRSADGWTCGTPVRTVLDGRDAILAVGMNGEPLPQSHGFPVRMVVPGLYGYVSATKWVVDLELTTFAAYDAYWVKRGYAEQAPIKTMTRIDTPKSLAEVRPGRVAIAGVAWAQHRGIDAVEVRFDNGPWQPARLADEASADTWRLWSYEWDASPGRHTVQARATDGTGDVQPEERAPIFPNGASGWHSVIVNVR